MKKLLVLFILVGAINCSGMRSHRRNETPQRPSKFEVPECRTKEGKDKAYTMIISRYSNMGYGIVRTIQDDIYLHLLLLNKTTNQTHWEQIEYCNILK